MGERYDFIAWKREETHGAATGAGHGGEPAVQPRQIWEMQRLKASWP